ECTLRETLSPLLLAELGYAASTGWARRRSQADPVRIPEQLRPAAPDAAGSLDDLLGRLVQAREHTDRDHSNTQPGEMGRPSVWVDFQVDVRFRLHRFGGHLAEHTIQCEKTL